ncbi:hypothetical protein Ndes2437A_g04233 [Nannochloris sp. 'desiccata']
MALRQLGKYMAGMATGVAATGAAHCAEQDKYFDPEALERGAKALREIQSSPFAKRVFEQIKAQEVTKQQELKLKEAEAKAMGEKAAIEHERVRWEEQRKAMQQDSQAKAQLAQYNDELARKRAEAEHEKQRVRNVELVRLQEESSRRQEEQRAAIAAQVEAERQAINTTFSNLGSAAKDLLTDQNKLISAVGGVSLLALGVYSAREGTRVAGKAFERWFGTPKLVRETSRKPLVGRGSAPKEKSSEEVRKDFSDVVLQHELQDHVRALAAVTANTKRHGAPFRHMLFYGPPGTGKTMAAKRLARTSGLDYAILSGGDVAPLGGGAVTQLHDTFDWAERSRKGLLLFIDEADAFLGRRSGNMSEGLRGALNAMLFRTGDQSRDFCVVLATNRPADLDPAVIDRMDEALEFALPGSAERKRILDIYFDKYVVKAGTAEGGAGAGAQAGMIERISAWLKRRKSAADQIQVRGVGEEELWAAAEATEGFSGRELAKFMASVQATVYGSHEPVLTGDMFKRVLELKLREHKQRQVFVAGPQD